MHGIICLQRAERDEAGPRPEGHGVSNDVLKANHGVQLAVVNVSILAEVDVGHPIEGKALQVANKIGRHGGDEAAFSHNACLYVVELQLGVVTSHLTWGKKKVQAASSGSPNASLSS